MTQLVDYAWTKPSASQIVAGGYAGVLRYLSWDPGKDLSAGERDALHAAGLSIGLVWETTATRAGQGYAAGVADVAAAEAKATVLGYPSICPLFYAVDFDASVAAVLPYFQGVLASSHYPVGVYGSASVVEGIPAPWKWQTVAWSRGRISAQAHIFQTTSPTIPGCDLNRLLHPVPLWGAGGVVSDTAFTLITLKPAPTQEDDDMSYVMSQQNPAIPATPTTPAIPAGEGFYLVTPFGKIGIGSDAQVDACLSALQARATRTYGPSPYGWRVMHPTPCLQAEADTLEALEQTVRDQANAQAKAV